MLHTKKFSLYDSMSAVEIYDPKMDLKAKLEESITLEYAIKNKNIIMPDDLSVEDVSLSRNFGYEAFFWKVIICIFFWRNNKIYVNSRIVSMLICSDRIFSLFSKWNNI